ncbi:glycosyltransferase family A protein [Stigmatella sp. ncwal1]|uniref:Glycosyltransferase family A protein n=1 Tax=Stigmatella ashevillensis TaxID=2995309 RepID=A0ABT5DNK7_9BACT|nr:glycosyltransferase family A protein [Stigmatella ashevillena]MDC0715237.1 glycosyltransferase family A protein [Stigmatella ashevillena]
MVNTLGKALEDMKVVEPLRAFVLGRVEKGSRIALFGGEGGLAQALTSAGCLIWAGGASELEALQRFAPTHVVLTGNSQQEGLEYLASAILAVFPAVEVLLGFANAGAASALLATLLEGAPGRTGPSEVGFRRSLATCGLRVVHREAHSLNARTATLAPATEKALRELLSELEPGAGDDVVLYALRRAPVAAVASARELDLLSVVLWCGPGQRHQLDEAVLSLTCQRYRPFEILLVEPEGAGADPEEAVRTLERYRRIEDFPFQHVRGPPGELMDKAIHQARGRYLAFFEASGLVYPGHFENLVQALRESEAAWAVSRAFLRVSRAVPAHEDYVETKIPFPLGDHLELDHLRQHPWLIHALLIDRSRVANVSLSVPDPLPGHAATLPWRLMALFEPVFLNGLATCEQRVSEEAPPAVDEGVGTLGILRSISALEQMVSRSRSAGQEAKGLRHRALDELDARLRSGAPWLHGMLRRTASRLLK